MERRLAAILAADVVGYSRLMGADEAGTLERLKSLHSELMLPRITERKGRIVKLMGDGLLAEFPSIVQAVLCAVDIQKAMTEREADLAEQQRIRLRIGVNLGDIIVEGSDIYGDGVNVAARLEGLSDPGDVSVSGTVFDHVKGKVELDFEDLGERRVKNIDRPVHVYRIRTNRTARVDRAEASLHSELERPALAVLPFSNLSNDTEQEYFADGLTEDLITALTHWRTFPVIARNSCFAYKGQALDIKQVARELGARYVIEGSVRKGGSRVRISAQLVDGVHGHHLWAERYDRALDDIFAVQDDMVQRITAVVAPEVDKAELLRSNDKRPEDLAVWDLCLRAKPLLRPKTRAANAQARELFLRAISARPDYSDAYAGLAQSFNQDVLTGAAEERTSVAAQAMAAATKAIGCDEASSWAHHELSTAYQWLNRLDDALAEARIAVELNPHDAYALHALGNKSDLAGDPEGIGYMERAQKLNPEDVQRHTHLTFLARAYVTIGNYGAAVDRVRQAIRRTPDYAPAHYILGIALGHLGMLDEARASLKTCDELSPGFVDSRRDWQPYSDEAKNEILREGLRATET